MTKMARDMRVLPQRFLRSSEWFPDRPALEVGDTVLTYRELRHRAASLAATLQLDCGERLSADRRPCLSIFTNPVSYFN